MCETTSEDDAEQSDEEFVVEQTALDGGKPEGQTTLDGGVAKPERGER